MALLPINDRVDAILKLDLAARMKNLGFRKRTRAYVRETKTLGPSPSKAIQLCEIKVGGSASSHEGVVSATLAVFYVDFVPLLTPWQHKLPAQVKEVDGQVRVQLGSLGPWKKPDHSWRLDATTDDAQVAKELADAVETFGVPFLDDMLDLEKIAACELPGVSGELQILALSRLGRKDEAKARIEALLASRPKEFMAVASLAGRLKIAVPHRPAK